MRLLLDGGANVDSKDKASTCETYMACIFMMVLVWYVWCYGVGMGGCRMERLPLVLPLGMDMSKLWGYYWVEVQIWILRTR